MPRARKEVELAIRLGNEPGALGKVLSTVADENVNVMSSAIVCAPGTLLTGGLFAGSGVLYVRA